MATRKLREWGGGNTGAQNGGDKAAVRQISVNNFERSSAHQQHRMA